MAIPDYSARNAQPEEFGTNRPLTGHETIGLRGYGCLAASRSTVPPAERSVPLYHLCIVTGPDGRSWITYVTS